MLIVQPRPWGLTHTVEEVLFCQFCYRTLSSYVMKFLVYHPTCAWVLSLKQIILILFNLKGHSKEKKWKLHLWITFSCWMKKKGKKRKMETKINKFFLIYSGHCLHDWVLQSVLATLISRFIMHISSVQTHRFIGSDVFDITKTPKIKIMDSCALH